MNWTFINTLARANLAAVLFACACLARAETPALEVPALPEPAYLTPDKMTSEDQIMLSEYSGSYNSCLSEVSRQQLQQQTDARHVVDYAMKTCAVKLEELNEKMTARNFEPNFRQGYIHMVSTKGANNALRNVMMGMAARQSAEPESSPAVTK